MERRCKIQLRFQVRTYDIDYAGIVSNIVYIRWLEDLRLALLDQHVPLESFVTGLFPGLAPPLPLHVSLPAQYSHHVWGDGYGAATRRD
jgi:hypothetical protein